MVLGLLSAQSEDGQLGVESGVNPFSPVLAVSAPTGMGGGGWWAGGRGGLYLKEISSLFNSIVFLCFFALFT